MGEKKELELNNDLNHPSSYYHSLSQFSAEKARSCSESYFYFYEAMRKITQVAGGAKRSVEFENRLTAADVDRIEAMGYTISSKENLDETTNIYETVKITW